MIEIFAKSCFTKSTITRSIFKIEGSSFRFSPIFMGFKYLSSPNRFSITPFYIPPSLLIFDIYEKSTSFKVTCTCVKKQQTKGSERGGGQISPPLTVRVNVNNILAIHRTIFISEPWKHLSQLHLSTLVLFS